jgi:formylglycine-generating enzyme required for sulfatase activity
MRLAFAATLIACAGTVHAPPPSPMPMVDVPAGTFTMGCNDAIDTRCNDDERPAHVVTLRAFSIDKYKVSQAQYAACIAAGACGAPLDQFDPQRHGDYPVNFVTWDEARAYCAWAGKRLPTEAEREYASRGTDGRLYPWGNASATCALATFTPPEGACSPSYVTTLSTSHPGSASPFGAEDMAGNLWEWVSDWYAPDFYASSPGENPQGPATGTAHAKRGGSHQGPADWLRTSRRWFHGSDSADDIGFRCAK